MSKYRKLKNTSYDPYAGGPYSGAYGQLPEHRDSMENLEPWYQRSSWVISLLILFFPAGLFLMWYNMKWSKPIKIFITIVVLVVALSIYFLRT